LARIPRVRIAPTTFASTFLGLLLLALAVIGPPLFGGEASRIDTSLAYQGPSMHAWAGTDGLGRNVLLRTLAATRLSLELAMLATLLAAAIGLPFGVVTATLGLNIRALASRAIQLGLALPGLLVAFFVVAILGTGLFGATIAIGLAFTPVFGRVAQTLAAGVADSDYMAAAKAIGVSRTHLVTRYILPNVAEPLILQAGLTVGLSLLALSALSFVGLGVQPPEYDWGRVLSDGLTAMYVTPLAAVVPGAAITISGITLGFLGEAFAAASNPMRRISGRAEMQITSSRTEGRRGRTSANFGLRPGVVDGKQAPVLRVDDLRVRFPRHGTTHEAVRGISFDIWQGEIVGLVGESGSGKSVTALAIAGLVPPPGEVLASRLEFQGVDVRARADADRRRLLATKLAIVFQDPMSALNPAIRIGTQLTEKVEVHSGMGHEQALRIAELRLGQTHVGAPGRRLSQYPHELSGGMRQRAMIAMGLMTEPALILADEPTTALDVTIQAQIIDLFRELNRTNGTAVLLISHDLAVVSELCSRVVVIYAGQIAEELPVEALGSPAHPYTKALLAAVMDLDTDRSKPLGAIPMAVSDPAGVGCPFASRCPEVMDRCRSENPRLLNFSRSERKVACWARVADGTVTIGPR
jgi:peptide/nickel transport system ATP-binding protein/peptide/nickel transport system permease protein